MVAGGFEELRALVNDRRADVLNDPQRATTIEVFSRIWGIPKSDILTHLSESACDLLNADAALCGIVSADRTTWHGFAHCTAPRTARDAALLMEWGVIVGTPLFFDDTTGYPTEFADVASLGWRGAAVLPFMNDGGVPGALMVGRMSGEPWSDGVRRAAHGLLTMNAILNRRRGEVIAEVSMARVEADARFGTIFERAPMGIVLVDDVGRFETVNAAFAELCGRTQSELVGMSVRDIAIPIDGDGSGAYLQEMLEGKRRSYTAERLMYHPNGTTLVVRVTTAQLRYRSDGKASHLAIVEDVTSQRESERVLREREEQLRQAQKMEAIGQLAGGLAHDFSNALAAIAGFSSLLREEIPLEDPRRRDVEGILRVTQDASSITRKLLTISKKQVQERAALDLRDVLQEFAALVRPVLPATIQYNTAHSPTPVYAMIDRTQIEQALLNIALNARDAMPNGGDLTVRVGTGEVALPGAGLVRVARISVSDTGMGMEPDVIARLWEPFFTTKARGSGLGLPMSLAILREHGGDLLVESRVGRGSTFTLVIPLAEAGGSGKSETPTGISLHAPPSGHTILLVEDEDAVRVTSKRLLERAGMTVLVAVDGIEAWRLFLASIEAVDVVVTDLIMPGMTGRELVQRIRANVPDMPVVITSAYPPDDAHGAGAAVPVEATLVKPFTGAVLVNTVREVLAKHPRRDRLRPSPALLVE